MRLSRRLLLVFFLLASSLWLTSGLWLPSLGYFLVNADQPAKADIVVVLGGDWFGLRVLKGADLVKQGFAPKALVSGPPTYEISECDLTIPMATRRGFPREYFEPYPHQGTSTMEEARAIADHLRAIGVKRILVVTSDYHTRRAGRIWRQAAPDLDIRMIAAEDPHFHPGSWWTTREGKKTWLSESIKVLTSPFGI